MLVRHGIHCSSFRNWLASTSVAGESHKVGREKHRELMKEGDDRLKGMRHHFLFNAVKLDEERQAVLNALQR